MKRILLQGQSHNGIYKIHNEHEPSSLSLPTCAFYADVSLWHSRLGYLAYPIVHKVLHIAGIMSSNTNKDFYTSHSFSPFQLLYMDLWVSHVKACIGAPMFFLL